MARFETLNEWLTWLETLHPRDIDLGLKRVFSVASRLGIIESVCNERFTGGAINADGSKPKVITIAGTNGKGSCVKSLESLILAHTDDSHSHTYSFLCDQVYVSSFTSPHILNYNERIKLNGLPLCNDDICLLFTLIDQARGDTSLTYFEFAALAALLAMHRSNSPVWVLEVGLGGRLDAVNIVDCHVAIITSIGLDHQAWLGDTLKDIAREKGGIMRPKTPVIFASQGMPNVLSEIALSLEAPQYLSGRDYTVLASSHAQYTLSTHQESYHFTNFGLPIESLSAAVVACETIQLPLTTRLVHDALSGITLAGRFEIIRHGDAVFILDVAHNEMATLRLAENVVAYCRDLGIAELPVAICGMMADKSIKNSLAPLIPHVSQWVCCDIPNNARAESAENLYHFLSESGVQHAHIDQKESVTQAVESVLEQQYHHEALTNNPQVYLVFGSFFTVSAAKTALNTARSLQPVVDNG